MDPDADPALARRSLHADFRPRRGRRAATWVGIGATALFLTIAIAAPGSGLGAFALTDRLGIAGIGLAIGWFLSRWALVVVRPSETGLRVRNLFTRRELTWPEVVAVRFGGGPWATLDLSDGESLPLLAIQLADGAWAGEEASRLATLVVLHAPGGPET